jgi:hypothetical protein
MDKLSRINRRACSQLANLRKKYAKVKLKKEFQGVNHPLYIAPLQPKSTPECWWDDGDDMNHPMYWGDTDKYLHM